MRRIPSQVSDNERYRATGTRNSTVYRRGRVIEATALSHGVIKLAAIVASVIAVFGQLFISSVGGDWSRLTRCE